VTISSASASTSEFSISGLTLPLTLSAGQSKSFTVTFTPQASGSASATLSVSSNASNSSASQGLTGTGAAAVQHSVSLSWNASTGTVAGYNIYRGTVSGGPYSKVNSALDVITSYTDSTVQSGSTYYYVTTAVDGSGKESAQSNQVQVVIPNP
jgi:fibronectin type 3 domain-containing protein